MAKPQRKLVSIVAMDIAGYARLVELDETSTLARVRKQRNEVIAPAVAAHGGRIVKTMGDGLLLEFGSAVHALQCMVELNVAVEAGNAGMPADRQIVFRVGLHLGDVVVEDGDILGDGVNIAARLENAALPGSIYISQAAYEAVQGKVDVKFVALGEHRLKNIARPVRLYQIGGGDAGARLAPDRPSIAVLPFANLSGDPDQEYFADGIVDDIITALSRFTSLLVIARNSSFTYKGRAVELRQIGRELGVRYALEGSVRRADKRLRISAQLVDCERSVQLWTERFDGLIDDIFDLQDQIAAQAAGAIARKLDRAEYERAKRTPVESLDAYECFLRGRAVFRKLTRESCAEVLYLCYKALEIHPDYAAPAALAGSCHVIRKLQFWTSDPEGDAREVRRLANHVAEVAGDDAEALCGAGQALAWVASDLEAGPAMVDRGLALNPNLASGWWARGAVSLYLGELARAVAEFQRSRRLNPVDPSSYEMQSSIALAQALLGNHAEALDFVGRALAAQPNSVQVLGTAAFAHAQVGNVEQARRFVDQLRRIAPMMTLRALPGFLPFQRVHVDRLVEGLRIAGLPE